MPTPDTSTPRDRQVFCNILEGGAGGATLMQQAVVVQNSTAPLPETTAYLLGLEVGATFAQGVALMQSRLAAGQRPV